jgi:hypothetical protein
MPASGRKKPKWSGKSEGAGDGFAAGQVFGLERLAVGGEDELGLGLGRGRAGLRSALQRRHRCPPADSDVDVVALEHAAGHVGGVVVAPARRRLRSCPCCRRRPGRRRGTRRRRRAGAPGRRWLFDFYCVHVRADAPRAPQHGSNRVEIPDHECPAFRSVHVAPRSISISPKGAFMRDGETELETSAVRIYSIASVHALCRKWWWLRSQVQSRETAARLATHRMHPS